MSHAIQTDATRGHRALALAHGHSTAPEQLSWRAAGFFIAALSLAGWVGIAVALRHLIA
jgi:hypothetical protein